MLPLFDNYLTNLQTEITEYEQKIEAKKQEMEKLNTLQSQVGNALSTLQNVVNSLKDVDIQALEILKKSALSLFQSSKSDERQEDIKTEDSAPKQKIDKEEEKIKNNHTPVVIETPTAATPFEQAELECTSMMTEESPEDRKEDKSINFVSLSNSVVYEIDLEITSIAIPNKTLAINLSNYLKTKNIGDDWVIKKAIYSDTGYALRVVGLTYKEAFDLADNLPEYLKEAEKPLPKHESEIKFNQNVQIIGGKYQKFMGLVGKVVSYYNDTSVFVEFVDGVKKCFNPQDIQLVYA